jgi:hypothetical protein
MDVPLTRIEQYLYNLIIGEGDIPVVPFSREERYLESIITGEPVEDIIPLTKIERYLDYWSKNTVITDGYIIIYMNSSGSDIIHIEMVTKNGSGKYNPEPFISSDGEIINITGWSSTAGGQAVTNITKNVNEHKTVYAVEQNTGIYIPDHIAVTTPPTKTEYEEGEALDFTGIEVTIYKKDDSVWTDTTHPQGKALFSELEFPVTVATLPEEGD